VRGRFGEQFLTRSSNPRVFLGGRTVGREKYNVAAGGGQPIIPFQWLDPPKPREQFSSPAGRNVTAGRRQALIAARPARYVQRVSAAQESKGLLCVLLGACALLL